MDHLHQQLQPRPHTLEQEASNQVQTQLLTLIRDLLLNPVDL